MKPANTKTNAQLALAAGISSVAQLRVMEALMQFGTLSMTRLAAEAGISTAGMTSIIGTLETTHGFVRRIRIPEDRRAVHVELMPAGQTFGKTLHLPEPAPETVIA